MAAKAGPGDRFNNNPPNQEQRHDEDLSGAYSYLSEFSQLHKSENRRRPSFVPRPSDGYSLIKIGLSLSADPRKADGTQPSRWRCPCKREHEEETMGRGILLWLLGVPIPVIILLWLFFGH